MGNVHGTEHPATVYPQPIKVQTITSSETTQQVTSQNLIKFPSVFDNKVKLMKVEQFHIALIDDAKPFCVKTPRTVPYAYRN